MDTASLNFTIVDKFGEKIINNKTISNVCMMNYKNSLVWNNNEYAIVWTDYRDVNTEIYFAHLNNNGTKIDNDIRITNNDKNSRDPRIVAYNDGYAITWTDSRSGSDEIYFSKISKNGIKLLDDKMISEDSNPSVDSSLIWNSNGFAATWTDLRNSNSEIYFNILNVNGDKLGNDIRITQNVNKSANSSLVWTGNEYGISFVDNRNGNNQTFFVRLNPDGEKKGDNIILGNTECGVGYNSITYTGSKYAIIFEAETDNGCELHFATFECGNL